MRFMAPFLNIHSASERLLQSRVTKCSAEKMIRLCQEIKSWAQSEQSGEIENKEEDY